MKKLSLFFVFILFLLPCGCFLDDGGGSSPSAKEEEGSGTLNVTVTYNGITHIFSDTYTGEEGTAMNYVLLYKDLGVKSNTYPVEYTGSSDINGEVITINDIIPGDYYVVVFYDYRSGDSEPKLTKDDPYSIYDGSEPEGTPYTAYALKILIGENETKSITMDFTDEFDLGLSGSGNGRSFLIEEE